MEGFTLLDNCLNVYDSGITRRGVLIYAEKSYLFKRLKKEISLGGV
jgi:hypothetical protein